MAPKLVRVVSNELIATGVHRIRLECSLNAQPGQFVMLWLPGIDEKPFAVAGCSPLTVAVAEVGEVSRRLASLEAGEILGVRGPFGRGFWLEGGRLLLVGGGYGAAALLPLAQLAVARGREAHVALGARSADRLVLAQDFWELGCRVWVATDDGSAGYSGAVTGLVEELLDQGNYDALYGCGPEGMLFRLAGQALGRIPCQLSVERYIKCGIGVCGQCTMGGSLVCVDGPVFEARELLANPEFGRFRRDGCGAKMPLVPEMAGARE